MDVWISVQCFQTILGKCWSVQEKRWLRRIVLSFVFLFCDIQSYVVPTSSTLAWGAGHNIETVSNHGLLTDK